jgi:hypothetical protein
LAQWKDLKSWFPRLDPRVVSDGQEQRDGRLLRIEMPEATIVIETLTDGAGGRRLHAAGAAFCRTRA